MTRFVRIILSFGLLSAFMVVQHPAMAADDSLEGYTPEQGVTVLETVEQVNGSTCLIPGGTGSYHKGTFTVTHRFGGDGPWLWKVTSKGETCVKNGKITAYRWNKWHNINSDPQNWWEWTGWTDVVNGGGFGETFVYRRVHAELRYCVIRIGCVKKAQPWIAITGRGSSPWFNIGFSKGM